MSTEVQALVWKFSPHKGSTLIVFLALADWSDDYGKSWPSVAKLSEKSRQSERNTQYCIRELEQDGYLQVVKRKETSSQYIINIAKLEGGAKIAPVPVEGVQNGTEGVQNGTKKIRQIAPNTLVIHQQDHTLNTEPSPLFELTPSELKDPIRPTQKEKQAKEKFVPPEWLPLEQWDGYVEMRKTIKHPLTPYAQKLQLKELAKLRSEGHNPIAVLEQSITKTYRGLFAPNGSNGTNHQPPEDALARERRKEAERRSKGAGV